MKTIYYVGPVKAHAPVYLLAVGSAPLANGVGYPVPDEVGDVLLSRPEWAEVPGDTEVGDLLAIRGIGPATVEDLNSIGVMTLADLAQADGTALAKRLNGSSINQVQRWIDQAQALVRGENHGE